MYIFVYIYIYTQIYIYILIDYLFSREMVFLCLHGE